MQPPAMRRAVGLRGALSVNVITMIGIGPLVTIPLVLSSLNGPLALIGWVAGAVVALCDGLVWAELSSRFPGSGGTYVYLREIFGSTRWGRLFAFLFNWQFLLFAPCLLASGYIGFANYAAYIVPQIGTSFPLRLAIEVALGVITTLLLYRRVDRAAAIGVGLAFCAVGTLLLVIAAAVPHADMHRALTVAMPVRFDMGFLAGFGGALFVTLYDYAGYSDAALLGDEVREPNRTIPLAIMLSVLIVALLYIVLQIAILGAVPWQSLVGSNGGDAPAQAQYVASTVVDTAWGYWPAIAVSALVLVTAFASVYGNLLGFSRIPFAAARDGAFFPAFARLHPTKGFPHVALLTIGALSLVACFFTLDQVIAILTAGIVLVQGIAQIVALVLLRARRNRAPFRMPLYPLPAIVAFVGWLLAFMYSGSTAIALGIAWLVAGTIGFLVLARRSRWWPFAAVALLALLPLHAIAAPIGAWKTWDASHIEQRNGAHVFSVNGNAFFVYGAAFFYERIPRAQWRSDLLAYRRMGINTIDLYLIWNWHELSDGNFDFTGRSNPRRDLRALFATIHDLGFKIIVRPGPVIRNEWRNGGYPAWLLRRPEYDMPLHDVLEGRYPATATFQNAHADAAADEWLHNTTHLRYASRWLRHAFAAIAPWSHDVIAVALDDDQGAYIDNDTWPAPHWHAYIGWLRRHVQADIGTRVPLFINTYQMKVTASAPVWAWGNWYQSDAYSIGDHDLAQLMFSTGLLQTQPDLPVMTSEFQAGWLQGADEVAPRAADPTNTTLALHEMLQMGVHGIVNFPVQDTLDPAGWSAPWSNWLYAWGAALTLQGTPSSRYAPTRDFGAFIAAHQPYVATLRPKSDAAIAWMVSAYDPFALTNGRIAAIATATIAAQQRCRALALTCRLVDLRYDSLADLRTTHVLIVPDAGTTLPVVQPAAGLLARYRATGDSVVTTADAARALIPAPANGGIVDSAVLLAPDGDSGILDVINADVSARTIVPATIHLSHGAVHVPRTTVAPRSAIDVPLRLPESVCDAPCHPERSERQLAESKGGISGGPSTARLRRYARDDSVPKSRDDAGADSVAESRDDAGADSVAESRDDASADSVAALLPKLGSVDGVTAFVSDAFRDGEPVVTLANRYIRVVISPAAGARAFVFEDRASGRNYFTTIGALRDDVATPLPPSPRDYIAAYTHPMPAGTFNRTYDCRITSASGAVRSVTCSYTAPDLAPEPVRFEKTFTLSADDAELRVDLRCSAECASLSAVIVDARLRVTTNAPGGLRSVGTHTAYRLLRVGFSEKPTFVAFRLQGATQSPANRP